ncbi:flagellar export chaperone FliS [Pseudoalteromonas tunicata]|jgi:flagellar protein FliS|uniref:Flagellar secretion chaperone FliS n=1 Tax=Pseudoalteromonas tunicata D2 TaxID=87626 RepID=A4C6E1_9GAMM|nr:flagellar export chaperone FliS [Pseudoalteromonas tunicata]ATC95520.1 flagellar protein FliS [Pseudoalteromonas tunicata]AXT31093.1 flagellar export chaperone FliS [Pseudoalteromonas tunicata]EAR29545.1 putative flagellar biosynthesis protein [Pseudoalteromonas tunicata D2]MDP4982525.1 flagellar export chaperone FliS [Pseudoalteromonas tunicata]
MSRLSIQKYKDMKINGAANANPYELINIVFTSIIGKLTAAKAYIDRNDYEHKGIMIGESISLFGALQDSLDMEKGGDISNNLYSLYEFSQTHLVQANVNNSKEMIDEILEIVKTIKEGWNSIPLDVRNQYLEQKSAVGA